jgi:hypothetical protein
MLVATAVLLPLSNADAADTTTFTPRFATCTAMHRAWASSEPTTTPAAVP